MDFFSNIAAKGMGGKQELLVKNMPPELDKKFSELKSGNAPIFTEKKISTKEELYALLKETRQQYAPFMENHAPKMESMKKRIDLKEFTLDGEKITLPYYGGPEGYGEQVYETTFTLDEVSADKTYYICFNGADYRAVVYVNGTCVGIHEGFFSPFSFNMDKQVKVGENKLRVELYNDFIYMGNDAYGHGECEGDKLYAATGLGWDDPQLGWHHCPPGMGIYSDVFVEIKNRRSITDVFVRENEIVVRFTEETSRKPFLRIRYTYPRHSKPSVFATPSPSLRSVTL